jgi:small-conductance mechanosensitive channel
MIKEKKRFIGHLILSFILLGIIIFILYIIYQSNYIPVLNSTLDLLFSKYHLYLPKIISIIVVILLGKFINTFIKLGFKEYSLLFEKDLEKDFIYNLVQYFTWFLVLIAILSIIVENLGVFITSLGLFGFGITFALQKPILNFVGWITIMFNHTYNIGDRVSIGNVRGDVLNVELMYTQLDGLLDNTDELSGKVVTIPNELVLTQPVINFTKTGNFIWNELEVNITYESNWGRGVSILRDIVQEVTDKYIKMNLDKKKEEKINDLFNYLNFFLDNPSKSSKTLDASNIKTTDEKKTNLNNFKDEKAKNEQRLIDEHTENRPIVRVFLKDSAIGLNVRYLGYYRKTIAMKSEINFKFLKEIEKYDDLQIAYPHLQLVSENNSIFKNSSRLQIPNPEKNQG